MHRLRQRPAGIGRPFFFAQREILCTVQIALPQVLTESGLRRTATTPKKGFHHHGSLSSGRRWCCVVWEGEAPAEPNPLRPLHRMRLGGSLALPRRRALPGYGSTRLGWSLALPGGIIEHPFGAPPQDNTRWLPPTARLWMPLQAVPVVVKMLLQTTHCISG
jgi:hypothetical protein